MPASEPSPKRRDLERFLRSFAIPVSCGKGAPARLRAAMTSFWSFADRGLSDALIQASSQRPGVDRIAVGQAASQWCTMAPPHADPSEQSDHVALLFAVPVILPTSLDDLPSVAVFAERLYRNLLRDGELTVEHHRFSLLAQMLPYGALPGSPDGARALFLAVLDAARESGWSRVLPQNIGAASAAAADHWRTGSTLRFVVGVCVANTTRPVFKADCPRPDLVWPQDLVAALADATGERDILVVPPSPYFLQSLALGFSFCCAQALMRCASQARSVCPRPQRLLVSLRESGDGDGSTLRIVFTSSAGVTVASCRWTVGRDGTYAPLVAALRQVATAYGVAIEQSISVTPQCAH